MWAGLSNAHAHCLGKVMTFFLVKLTVLEPPFQHSWIRHCLVLAIIIIIVLALCYVASTLNCGRAHFV